MTLTYVAVHLRKLNLRLLLMENKINKSTSRADKQQAFAFPYLPVYLPVQSSNRNSTKRCEICLKLTIKITLF